MERQGLPGFRDFYPEDLATRNYIFAVWRDVARRYGFEEYDGPPLEPLDLYTRKSGSEIVEQLYEFVDKGDRQIALRPEMTPTLARMVGAHAKALRKPVRWFSIPQLFRYERQQRGRLREHFQLNVDIIGESDVLADAELLSAAIDVVRSLGLTAEHVRARVSDRRLLAAIFRHVGVPQEAVLDTFQAIDRLERESRERLEARLVDAGLDEPTIRRVFETTEMRGMDDLAEAYGDVEGVSERIEELARYLEYLGALGVGDYVDVDLSVVRGLAYYTGIVFELWDARRELRAICGGGRYDDLLEALSDTDLPALGFGMGDVVLVELLREHDLIPEYQRSLDCFLVVIGDEAQTRALRTARELRDAGLSVAYDFRGRAVGAQFKSADSLGARYAIVIGPEELEAGQAQIKEMASGAERALDFDDLIEELRT